MVLTNETIGNGGQAPDNDGKNPHPYEFFHDEVGYNYRLPEPQRCAWLRAANSCQTFESSVNLPRAYRIFQGQRPAPNCRARPLPLELLA